MNLEDLKPQKRWVCYRTIENKAPINARTGGQAMSNEPGTWHTYADAVAAMKRHNYAGVGFMFTGDDGLIGIDFDDCLNETEDGMESAPIASAWRSRMLHTYAELSPSRTGFHVLGFAKLPHSLKRKVQGVTFEIYGTVRYFTVTQEHIDGHADVFADIQDVVDDLYEFLHSFDKPTKKPTTPTVATMSRLNLPEKWVHACYANWEKSAIGHIVDAVDGDRHYARLRAGRLLGGALATVRQYGYDPMSDDAAIRMLYDCRVPAQGAQRKEYRVIEDGFMLGLTSPLEMPMPEPPPPPMEPRYSAASIIAAAQALEGIQETAMDLSDDVERMKRVYHLTDVGNGIRFADYYRGIVSYVIEWQQWMVWDGKRWQRTDAVEMRRLAHDLVLTMYKGAAADGVINQELSKWAMKSESAARINAMLDSAQPYLVVPASLFDAQHDVLNVANGMLNLVDGTVRPHDPLAYHTKLVDIEYDDAVSMEWWVNFMLTIFDGDIELIEYMQRAVGYTLTGRTDEHCLFFCYGTGKNGKSTFMRALEVLLGSYSTITSVEALLDASKQGEGATPYMAKLPGMRMAMAQEMPEGRRMNESLVKSITSSDSISARDMYKSVFTFSPTHKLWITGNHLPRISGTDDGIWRRLRIVPFTVTIPETKRKDSRVIEAELQHHIKGLLRWAVMGAMQWAKSGLKSCKAVERATLQYRGEEDAVQRFINDRCELSPVATVNKGKLFSEWQAWVSDEGDRIMGYKTQRWLIRQLVGRFKCESGGDGRSSVIGIRLKPDDDIGNHLSS